LSKNNQHLVNQNKIKKLIRNFNLINHAIQFLRTSTCYEAQPLFGINLKDVQEFSGEAKNFIFPSSTPSAILIFVFFYLEK
jgi:hypothetical protein